MTAPDIRRLSRPNMSEDLANEIEAINSIYGEDTITQLHESTVGLHVLSVPCLGVSLRLLFPSHYPHQPPTILGIEATTIRKGYGAQALTEARETLSLTFTPGSVCLFDLLQSLENKVKCEDDDDAGDLQPFGSPTEEKEKQISVDAASGTFTSQPSSASPQWTLSEIVVLKKSTFVARACHVFSPAQSHAAVADLIENDKRAAKATHNISAYRIHARSPSNPDSGLNGTIYQDCDDDGETAAGGRLLHLLQVMNVWNILVVVTRWYGGVQLGPDRFRIISQVAREAVTSGGWIRGGGRES